TVPGPRQWRPIMSKRGGGADASVRSPWSGTSRIVIDASPNATAGAAKNAATATRANFTAPSGCLRHLSASSPLIESLRVEERRFAGTFTPRSGPGVRLAGCCRHTARPRDPFRRRRQPGDSELPLPPARAGSETALRRGGDRPQHPGRPAAVEGQDRPLRAQLEGARTRLGRAERLVRRIGGRL